MAMAGQEGRGGAEEHEAGENGRQGGTAARDRGAHAHSSSPFIVRWWHARELVDSTYCTDDTAHSAMVGCAVRFFPTASSRIQTCGCSRHGPRSFLLTRQHGCGRVVAALRYKIIGAGGMLPAWARGGGACLLLIGDDGGGEALRRGSAAGRLPATTARARQ